MFTSRAASGIHSHADIRRMQTIATRDFDGSVRDLVLASETEDELESNVQTYLSLLIVPFVAGKTDMFFTSLLRENPHAQPRTLAAGVVKVFRDDGNVDKALTTAEATITAVVTESKTKGMLGDMSLSIVGAVRFVPTNDATFAEAETVIADLLRDESKVPEEATEEAIDDEEVIAQQKQESERFHTEVLKMLDAMDKFESPNDFVGDVRAALADSLDSFNRDSIVFVPHMCSGKSTFDADQRRLHNEQLFIAKRTLHDAACLITSEPVMPADDDSDEDLAEDRTRTREFRAAHGQYMVKVRKVLSQVKKTAKHVRHLFRGGAKCSHCKMDVEEMSTVVMQSSSKILDVAVAASLETINNGDVVETVVTKADFMTDVLYNNLQKLLDIYGYCMQRDNILVPCNIANEAFRARVGTVDLVSRSEHTADFIL